MLFEEPPGVSPQPAPTGKPGVGTSADAARRSACATMDSTLCPGVTKTKWHWIDNRRAGFHPSPHSVQPLSNGDGPRDPETDPRLYRDLGWFAAGEHGPRYTSRGSSSNADGRALAASRRSSYRSTEHRAHTDFRCVISG